jgi:hypothetical protein
VSTPYVRFWYAIMVAFLACLVVAIASVGYASWVNHEAQKRSALARQDSDRRWCALLTDLDGAYGSTPKPTTETGRKVAAEIHKLRVAFGCPER